MFNMHSSKSQSFFVFVFFKGYTLSLINFFPELLIDTYLVSFRFFSFFFKSSNYLSIFLIHLHGRKKHTLCILCNILLFFFCLIYSRNYSTLHIGLFRVCVVCVREIFLIIFHSAFFNFLCMFT